MDWTTDTPTQPGYYWVKPPYSDEEYLVDVFGHLGWKAGDKLFTPWDFGASVEDKEVFPYGTKWFGPIEIQKPPK